MEDTEGKKSLSAKHPAHGRLFTKDEAAGTLISISPLQLRDCAVVIYLQLNSTSHFSVIDLKGAKQTVVDACKSKLVSSFDVECADLTYSITAAAGDKARTQGGRTKAAAAGTIKKTGGIKIGGDFERTAEPEFIPHRIACFEACLAKNQAAHASKWRFIGMFCHSSLFSQNYPKSLSLLNCLMAP